MLFSFELWHDNKICMLPADIIPSNYHMYIFVVYLHLQPRDVFPAHVWYIRVPRMGHGDWLAIYSIIIIVHSCCDDIQTDEHYWNYQRGMNYPSKGYLEIRSLTSICLGVSVN